MQGYVIQIYETNELLEHNISVSFLYSKLYIIYVPPIFKLNKYSIRFLGYMHIFELNHQLPIILDSIYNTHIVPWKSYVNKRTTTKKRTRKTS